ncbi:acyltransferase family protein [Parahaliea mediterranea]|uniref:Acyltransferase n=1 Tax=Parahaliea mediterranea TaxID=651086 RepID=A0A939DIH3_9GAMM|nr:acyltransferase family protein [Parahaliea mediterranea]MBN7798848.1 acyltransferase [Parahaliea mediterranea]
MHYRADIDGLRAIAVLAVVVFHLGISQLSGGFVGVDVFFVISGYLITAIISDKISRDSFQLADFYGRRVRRLFPPLIATVAVTFIAAACILEPLDFTTFGRSATAALFSVSNFVFLTEAGYWDTASELKPLLHTWSLGVEEQFYLLWPALLLATLRGGRDGRLTWLLIVVGTASFAACVWWTGRDSLAAFYLLPFRMFEFALGAAVLPLSRSAGIQRALSASSTRDRVFAAGVLMIAWSAVAFDNNTAFPGWVVAWPTLGSVLILLAGSGTGGQGPIGAMVLCNPVSLWLGKVSYSLYLTHWPIVSLYRYASGDHSLAIGTQIALAAVTLLATVVLHYGVELRFYQRVGAMTPQRSARRRPISAPGIVLVSALFAVAPVAAWLGDGWPWRRANTVLSSAAVTQGMDDRFQLVRKACSVTRWRRDEYCSTDRPIQVLVFGNSHEPDAFNFLHAAYADDPDINLIQFGSTNNCPNLKGAAGEYHSTNETCTRRFAALFRDEVISQLDVIVYAAARPFRSIQQIHLDVIGDIMARNSRVKLATVGGYIATREPCWRLINRHGSSTACALPANVTYFEDQPSQWPLYEAFMAITDLYIDRVGLLCKDRKLENCVTQTPASVPMFYDRHHHSIEFARYAGQRYESEHPGFLKRLVGAPDSPVVSPGK